MASTIKVTNIDTPDSTGNITVDRPLSGSGASLTALNATQLTSGTVPTARLGSGTANTTVFLRGDGSWQTAGSTSASDLSSGTLPMARLSGTLPALNGSALTNLPAAGSRKNLIINGNMTVAQRGTSFVTPANNAYTLDRWRANISGGGAITVTQDTDVPTGQGFDKSIKLDVTTADASIGAGDFFGVAYRMEAYDASQLELGTANAKAITLSFWVKSTITGTYYVAFRNSASDRNYCASYTVSSADTWEKKTISITMDTSGTWVSGTNGIGMEIRFSFMSGSTYHGTANTWQAGNLFAASGIANGISSTSNNVYLTGVKFEVGSSATDFEHNNYVEELKNCQRYYYAHIGPNQGSNQLIGKGAWNSATQLEATVHFKETMRTTATLVTVSGTNYYRYHGRGTSAYMSWVNIHAQQSNCASLYTTIAGTLGLGANLVCTDAAAYVHFDAEL